MQQDAFRLDKGKIKDIVHFLHILSKIQFLIFSIYNINTVYRHIMLTTTSTTLQQTTYNNCSLADQLRAIEIKG